MTSLQSYLAGRWAAGEGPGTPLVDPTTGEVLAHASSAGLDLAAALRHGREVGGPALRAMGFPARAAALATLAGAIHAKREELIELSVRNAGNTRSDAKFDVDGATATLTAYAHFGKNLPERPYLLDGEAVQLSRSPRFVGQHLRMPRRGVAVLINAFNFPAWGMFEKAACALLAGMPVLCKPGTPTALVAELLARAAVESGAFPEGAFQFLVGSAGDLLEHLDSQDVVAFTGSSGTAETLRRHAAFVERGARLNVEADSLNAAVLGPDVEPETEAFDLFLREVTREMTQKAGQKCTAVRRILVPAARVEAVCEALAASLASIVVGDPREAGTRMGPLTNEAQLEAVQAGIARLQTVARTIRGGPERLFPRGAFLAPTLLCAADGRAAPVHSDEVFGPVATVLPYDGTAQQAAEFVRLGDGMLVASAFTDDKDFAPTLALELLPWAGRVYLAGEKVAEHATGHGLVLPALVHGGPGRAGGGEELGGLRGLDLYMQRSAVQGFRPLIETAFGA